MIDKLISQISADIIQRYTLSSRLILLFGVIITIILVVVFITMYENSLNEKGDSTLIISVVVSAVSIFLFVAVSISCLQSSKKRALSTLSQQAESSRVIK